MKLCFSKPQLLLHRGIHLQKQFSTSLLPCSIWPVCLDSPDSLLRLLKTVILLTALLHLCPPQTEGNPYGTAEITVARGLDPRDTNLNDYTSVPSEQETGLLLVLCFLSWTYQMCKLLNPTRWDFFLSIIKLQR